jgi:hypothetical protein
MRSAKILAFVILVIAAHSVPARSQIELIGQDPFPAAMEFKEISAIQAERSLKSPAELAKLEQGTVLIDTGLKRYAERLYTLSVPGSLAVEIMTFSDPREAYSALTLMARTAISSGPPGDFLAQQDDALLYSAGPCLIRLRAQANQELARRVALSIANRIGRKAPGLPPLVRHLPLANCDPASIRYFAAAQALAAVGTPVASVPLKMPAEIESVQARYSSQAGSGTITLLSFPTAQSADAFYNSGALYSSGPQTGSLFTRQTGPLIGILEGNFLPEDADKLLSSIKFEYSIKWIFDKNKNQGRIVWGVPVRILGTVVRSLIFTALLCLASILVGASMAAGRMYMRKRLGHGDSDAYIRLKLDEN